MSSLILLIIFTIAIFINIPIAYALIIGSVGVIFISDSVSMNLLIQTLFTSVDSFPLLAVPFFMLAGNIMMRGGISKRLIAFSSVMLGNLRASLGLVTVFSSMIFAALSGSGVATAAAIGGIMIPAMIDDGYDKAFSASIAAASGSLGPLIPPSILFVMYGITAKVSITDLFISGIIPGIMVTIALMIYTYIVSRKYNFGTIQKKKSAKEKWNSFKDAIWALIMPVIILGGIYGGIFTPTEAAVVSSAYGIIVSMFIYKETTLRELIEVFKETTASIGGLIVVLAGATMFGKILTIDGVPRLIAEFITGFSTNKIVILLLVNLLLFITGMFLDPVPAIIILAPLLLPLVGSVGVDPLHFGQIMVLNLVIGLCTPPVGMSIFITSRVAKLDLTDTFRWLFPVIGVILLVLMIVTFIPQISLLLN